MPVVGLEPRGPALELRERRAEPLPARLGQLDLVSVAVVRLDVAESLAHEELLELRVLLEVVLLVTELDLVERRNGDVDVPALEQLAHVPVEERQHERAD